MWSKTPFSIKGNRKQTIPNFRWNNELKTQTNNSLNKTSFPTFQEFTPKTISNFKNTKQVNTITDLEEQILLVEKHNEGKSDHHGIDETVMYLKTIFG